MTTAAEPVDLDDDGDGMPNAWERQYGLNPDDPTEAASDHDHDGLTAFEELEAGADPNLADTDGDEVSDGMEVHDMGSNPLLADITGVETALSVDGANATNRLGSWQEDGARLFALGRRGALTYSMTIPTADVYRVEIEGAAHDAVEAQTNCYELLVDVDQEYLGRRILIPSGVADAAVQCSDPLVNARFAHVEDILGQCRGRSFRADQCDSHSNVDGIRCEHQRDQRLGGTANRSSERIGGGGLRERGYLQRALRVGTHI